MFKRLSEATLNGRSGDAKEANHAAITVTIDGRDVACRVGDTVAAALFAHDLTACRDTPVSQTPRGPYCMMGVCYDCLVMIDGQANQQACMTLARAGMQIAHQPGAREVAV